MRVRVYSTALSTNCERVALAAAHKGVEVEWVDVPYDDRTEVEALSGQALVPVLVDGDLVLPESMEIVRRLEEQAPEPPLWPAEPARRAELDVFVDWFDRVWKRPPNLLTAELERHEPDPERVRALGGQVTGFLPRFERLLEGRDWLFGDGFSAADVCAFPFLKYALLWDEGDEHLFHAVLRDRLRLDGSFPRLEAWIRRVDELPRA